LAVAHLEQGLIRESRLLDLLNQDVGVAVVPGEMMLLQ
jgi:hypothetical protein